MPSAFHDPSATSIERGNMIGDRPSVRAGSKFFKEYESGNAVKSLLGTEHLRWDAPRKDPSPGQQRTALAPTGHQPRRGEGDAMGAMLQDTAAADGAPAGVSANTSGTVPRFGRRSSREVDLEASGGGAPGPAPGPAPAPPLQPRRHVGQSSIDPLADSLWSAVGAKDLEEVQRIVKRGGDVNMVCPDGWVRDECRPKEGGVGRSLLHHAAWAGSLEVFAFLVSAGADVERRRNTAWRPNGGVRGRGSTCLHHAVMYNREDIVLFLLDELGCEINAPGEQGYTPLHLAAKFNYPKLVETLLKRGARTDMLTKDEKTARDLACAKQERSHEQMGDMLAAFDRYDADAKRRARLPAGAPLPPDPRFGGPNDPRLGGPNDPRLGAPPPSMGVDGGLGSPGGFGSSAFGGGAASPPPPPPPLQSLNAPMNAGPYAPGMGAPNVGHAGSTSVLEPSIVQRGCSPLNLGSPEQMREPICGRRGGGAAAAASASSAAWGTGERMGGMGASALSTSGYPTMKAGFATGMGQGSAAAMGAMGTGQGMGMVGMGQGAAQGMGMGQQAGGMGVGMGDAGRAASPLRPDQQSDKAAAATRMRAMGSRPW